MRLARRTPRYLSARARSCRVLRAVGAAAWLLALGSQGGAAFTLGGCGGEYGGAAHASERAYVPDDRAYRLWYLAPPWVLTMTRASGVTLMVPLNADELLSGGHTTPVITLDVAVEAGTTPAALLASRVAAANTPGSIVRYDARAVTMAGGAMGLESAVFNAMGVQRFAAVALADGRTAVLAFTSGTAIEEDPDVAHMIAEFEPRSPGM